MKLRVKNIKRSKKITGFYETFLKIVHILSKEKKTSVSDIRNNIIKFINNELYELVKNKPNLKIKEVSIREIKRIMYDRKYISARAALIIMYFYNYIIDNFFEIKEVFNNGSGTNYTNYMISNTFSVFMMLINRDMYRNECDFFVNNINKIENILPDNFQRLYEILQNNRFIITLEDWGIYEN